MQPRADPLRPRRLGRRFAREDPGEDGGDDSLLAPVWDAAALWGDHPVLWAVGFWTTLAGCLVALVAAGAGFVDYVAIDPDSRASTIATYHLSGMLAVVAVFGGILWVRGGAVVPVGTRPYWVLALDVLGVGLLALV